MIIFKNTRDNEVTYTVNTLDEDFVKFLVGDLASNEFNIYYLDKSPNDSDMKGRLELNGNDELEVYQQNYTGSEETDDLTRVSETLIHTHSLTELSYPYDQNGKFKKSLWGV